jgi:hypothetical protein
MKKRFLSKVAKLVTLPFRWIYKRGFLAGLNWLRRLLEGRDTLKEELRKAGWGLTGIGVSGTLINGKPLAYLVVLGIIMWLLGLIESDYEGKGDGQ